MKLYIRQPASVIRIIIKADGHKSKNLTISGTTTSEAIEEIKELFTDKETPMSVIKPSRIQIVAVEMEGKQAKTSNSCTLYGLTPVEIYQVIMDHLNKDTDIN